MKSDRRHELRHNDLAEWILKGYEQVVPYKNAISARASCWLFFFHRLGTVA